MVLTVRTTIPLGRDRDSTVGTSARWLLQQSTSEAQAFRPGASMAMGKLWLRRSARAAPGLSHPGAAALRCRAALPLIAASRCQHRHLSDRADYKHTERELSKGRRASERAAYATLGVSHDASEPEIKAQQVHN